MGSVVRVRLPAPGRIWWVSRRRFGRSSCLVPVGRRPPECACCLLYKHPIRLEIFYTGNTNGLSPFIERDLYKE